MCRRFEGRTAIVTGAGSGLGLATAERLASEGAAVACADRDGDSAKRAATRITRHGGRAFGFSIDVTDPISLERLVGNVSENIGSIDALHANAGVRGDGTALDTALEDWNRVIAANLTGIWLSIRAVLPSMLERRRGAIVTTASVGGLVGVPRTAAYSAAKGGVIALTRQVAIDYGPHGVRANAICPSTVPTPLVEQSYRARIGGDPVTGLKQRARAYPLRRLGRPEDVAALVAFLASDDSEWITGATYVIDGGATAADATYLLQGSDQPIDLQGI